ncbi:MAG: imidazolonepropionase [Bacteroidota bacterium]|nr:imidazolonepropionase [Bacteroidota bacterium]
MKDFAITNIKNLVGVWEQAPTKPLRGDELSHLPQLANSWLAVQDGLIAEYGQGVLPDIYNELPHIDAQGGHVLPCFVDSHTHIVYATSREQEFVARIKGQTYEEIAANGGGILNSAKRVTEASEEELFHSAFERLLLCVNQGTGAIEIKSGYGLSTESELKMLRVIKRLKNVSPIPIKATFLGAHAFPMEFKNNQQAYIDIIINEMLPQIAENNLADYIDVFCDRGFFDVAQTCQILRAGAQYGLKGKIHGNELGLTGGVQAAVAENALSVDHLEHTSEEEIILLANSSTIGTLLPSTAFFLGIPYPNARGLIGGGAAVCLASDFNPGSSPSGRMSFVISLACIKMKMTPAEAINAATVNAAFALELQDSLGTITKGKLAKLIITKPISSLEFLPYNFGGDIIEKVL